MTHPAKVRQLIAAAFALGKHVVSVLRWLLVALFADGITREHLRTERTPEAITTTAALRLTIYHAWRATRFTRTRLSNRMNAAVPLAM